MNVQPYFTSLDPRSDSAYLVSIRLARRTVLVGIVGVTHTIRVGHHIHVVSVVKAALPVPHVSHQLTLRVSITPNQRSCITLC